MKDFIELLVEKHHLPKFLASDIMLIFYIASGCIAVAKMVYTLWTSLKTSLKGGTLYDGLYLYFDQQEIRRYTKHYVPQFFQNIAPSEGDEPGVIHAATARSKIMPEFLDKSLLDESPKKYFMILADTGMGKTAFLINLFKGYVQKRKGMNRVKHDIRLIPLGSSDALKRIEDIPNKGNTILLLDAFDEDILATHDYISRMNQLLESVKEFRKVVFTCRTQFFPSSSEEPYETKDLTFGENRRYYIQKLYLSAFNDKDVLRYLIKKYSINIFRLIKAYKLSKKSPSLMFRPMLLTYIDDLIKINSSYEYPVQIYHALINMWVDREASKPALINKYNNADYKRKLLQFSSALARDLYQKRDDRGGYFISVAELEELGSASEIDAESLTIGDKTGRSLLNRTADGKYKFSHKSILEYFLATDMIDSADFYFAFDFQGMDATKQFYNELSALSLRLENGIYSYNSELPINPVRKILNQKHQQITLENSMVPRSLSILKQYEIEDLQSITLHNFNYEKLNLLVGLRNAKLIILTNDSMQTLYYVYCLIAVEKYSADQENPWIIPLEINRHISQYHYFLSLIKRLMPQITMEYLKRLFNCPNVKINRLFNKVTLAANHVELTEAILLLSSEFAFNANNEERNIETACSRILAIQHIERVMPGTKFLY